MPKDRIGKRKSRQEHGPRSCPKLMGADVELGNVILGSTRTDGTGYEAARALLREIPGAVLSANAMKSGPASSKGYVTPLPVKTWQGGNPGTYYSGGSLYDYDSGWSGYGQGVYDPQDWGRKFLKSNGGCIYVDMDHLELCIPEVLSARDYLAAWHAMLRIAREAMRRANAGLGRGEHIQVLVNNSDGHGNSYGSHSNFLVSRECYERVFHSKLHQLLYLSSYLVSSIVFTGAGKVGSENGSSPASYQISQRADFFEQVGPAVATTHNRPIVNSRDESLCGTSLYHDVESLDEEMARLHVIFFDNTLCHVSTFLKAGATQLFLAMLEQEHVISDLILDDPLQALESFGRDTGLQAKACMVSGREYTAVEVQLAILEEATRFVEAGKADGIVPGAREILALWQETLEQLRQRDFASLIGKLDWVLKLTILEQAVSGRELQWNSPEVKHLDHMYSSLDVDEGLYWAFEKAGVVRRLVSDEEIERFVHEPPENTRAWLRAHVLRKVKPERIVDIDWDEIRLKFPRKESSSWTSYSYYTLPMHDPLGCTKARCRQAREAGGSPNESLRLFGMRETTGSGQGTESAQEERTDLVLASESCRARTGKEGPEGCPTGHDIQYPGSLKGEDHDGTSSERS